MNHENIIVTCGRCHAKNRVPAMRMGDRPICGKCGARLKGNSSQGRVVEVTDRSFGEEVLSSAGAVLVDCWAPWCGPCRMVAPVLEQLATEYAGRLKVAKLNVDDNPMTASRYGIQSIPTMLLFKNGNQVTKLVGALPKAEIERQLRSYL